MTQHHHKHATPTHAGPGKRTSPTKVAVVSRDNDHNGKLVLDEDIRFCAYQKWEAAGKPTGDGIQFWLEAEQDLVEGPCGRSGRASGPLLPRREVHPRPGSAVAS